MVELHNEKSDGKFYVSGGSYWDGSVLVRSLNGIRDVDPNDIETGGVWARVRDGQIVQHSGTTEWIWREPTERERAQIVALARQTTPPPVLCGEGLDFFLLFGELPDVGDRLSAFEIRWDPSVGAFESTEDSWCGTPVADAIYELASNGGPAYLVSGRQDGTGDFDEPIVEVDEVVCPLEVIDDYWGFQFRPEEGRAACREDERGM